MDDADQLIALVDDRHCHDTVLLHSIEDRARQLTTPRQLGVPRHDAADRDAPEIFAALDEPAEISRSEYPINVGSCVYDHRYSTPLRNHDDRLPHRVSVPQDGELIAKHDLVYPRHQRPAKGAARVQPCEVLAPEALLLKEGNGQRVTHGERGRRASRRSEVVGAGLLTDTRVEHDVRVARKGRARIAGNRNGTNAET